LYPPSITRIAAELLSPPATAATEEAAGPCEPHPIVLRLSVAMAVLQVTGMMCGHCTGSVEAALRAVAGVSDVVVDLESGQATVTGGAVNELLAAVTAAGYACAPVEDASPPAVTVLHVEGMMWYTKKRLLIEPCAPWVGSPFLSVGNLLL
jgi:copper chaperone